VTKKRFPGEYEKFEQTLTQECVRRLWDYDPETGHLTWRIRTHRTVIIGRRAGFPSCQGYRAILINKKRYQEHRVIWLHVHGSIPDEIDHINGDRSDNHLVNLRPCERFQNNGNSKTPVHNKSGVKGVFWDKAKGRWCAQIKRNGRSAFLGRFDEIADAKAAYDRAAVEYFGDFARAG
jgi:hypothetical protein